jgi:U3 small nucleolar RNA-associated protein 19
MPAYLVAAFVKRIARLSLNASPSVITWVIPFVYNMFKAHSAIRVLIQRNINGTDAKKNDPFNMSELDPSKCKAIESSIWEIYALNRHYWTGAVKQSKIFTERLTKPVFKLDDFLNGPTYSNLIEEELGHKWTKVPPLNIKISESIF